MWNVGGPLGWAVRINDVLHHATNSVSFRSINQDLEYGTSKGDRNN